MLALDVVRLEAGLILLEVDYTSARHALIPEQSYSPYEIGLGRLVTSTKGDFVGRRALDREARRAVRRAGSSASQLDWYDIEGLYDAQGLPPAIARRSIAQPVPVFAGRPPDRPRDEPRLEPDPQAGRSRSPRCRPQYEAPGTHAGVEWTVEGRRGRVGATVVALPFLDLPRKRA